MKMSSKARYALYVVVELARQQDNDQCVSVSTLAKNTGVTEKYLEQILALLRRDNIVTSTRGAAGGYKLSADSGSITVGQVLRCVEDNLQLVKCIGGNCKDSCNCVSHNLWVNLHQHINSYLDTITLQELLEEKL